MRKITTARRHVYGKIVLFDAKKENKNSSRLRSNYEEP